MSNDDLQLKLQLAEKNEVFEFIQKRLSFDIGGHFLKYVDEKLFFEKEHKRFNMSGYENETGGCTKLNMEIVNEFADIGIYDYTDYLFLDFYKGTGTLYFRYFGGYNGDQELDLSGMGTVEIIYEIFKKTIFSDRAKRRRK